MLIEADDEVASQGSLRDELAESVAPDDGLDESLAGKIEILHARRKDEVKSIMPFGVAKKREL